MKSVSGLCAILFLVLGVLGTGVAHGAPVPRRVTLSDAVRMALENGWEIQAADQGVFASQARVRGAGSQRFPRLKTEANLLYWDRPLDVVFSSMPGMPATDPSRDGVRVRDQVTWQASVSLAQPISGLFVLSRLVAQERDGLDAARADKARASLDTAQRTSEAYLRLLQAKAVETVAGKNVAQVEAQLRRAQVFEKAGTLGQVDVLRLTSAHDSSRQELLRAKTAVMVATAALVLSMDLPPGTALEVVDDLPDPPPPLTWTEEQISQAAAKDRPELVAAQERTAAARGAREVAKAALLPNIMAVATYQHVEGQAAFQPKNAWFVGATLTWDVWDWGKTWSDVKEAEHKANQANANARFLRDQIVFDAGKRLLEARTAYETVGVARSALEAAEEAYRIQSVRYSEGAATTTDVLDTQTDVARARNGYAQARYEYYLAQAGLARAVGRTP